jgi:PAS domain-containing protein
MGQRPVEIVLMRQLASYLAVPILIVDRNLDLLFFNESAEPILGRRFEETGEIHRGEWNQLLRQADANGTPIPREEQPLALAIDGKQPSHGRSWLTGFDGVARAIEGIGFPLETPDTGLIGAAGIFWEVREQTALAPTPAERPGRSRHPVEVVLLKRLAERLLMPIVVHDAGGRLAFYNPAAEPLIGRPFAELGPIELGEWYDAFSWTDDDGSTLKLEDHPMRIARIERRPSQRSLFYQGLDGVRRQIEGTAFPLLGQCNRHLGAVGIFWEGSS